MLGTYRWQIQLFAALHAIGQRCNKMRQSKIFLRVVFVLGVIEVMLVKSDIEGIGLGFAPMD